MRHFGKNITYLIIKVSQLKAVLCLPSCRCHRAWDLPYHSGCSAGGRRRGSWCSSSCCPRTQCRGTYRTPHTCCTSSTPPPGPETRRQTELGLSCLLYLERFQSLSELPGLVQSFNRVSVLKKVIKVKQLWTWSCHGDLESLGTLVPAILQWLAGIQVQLHLWSIFKFQIMKYIFVFFAP